MIHFKRVRPGTYESTDGFVNIQREVSQQTRRADEIVWTIRINGRIIDISHETLQDAKDAVWRYIKSVVQHRHEHYKNSPL